MSGLLRRFRRPKPKDEDEEPAETPATGEVEESDIYPHRGPDRAGDPDIESPPERPAPSENDESIPTPELPDEIGPAPATDLPSSETRPGPGESPVVPTVEPLPLEPVPGVPVSAPPPLPEAEAGSGRNVHRHLSASSRCFLCGTEMNGSFCPTCRMSWNE